MGYGVQGVWLIWAMGTGTMGYRGMGMSNVWYSPSKLPMTSNCLGYLFFRSSTVVIVVVMLSTSRCGIIWAWLNSGARFFTFNVYVRSWSHPGCPMSISSWSSEIKNCDAIKCWLGRPIFRMIHPRLCIVLHLLHLKSKFVFIRNCGSGVPSGRSWCGNIILYVLRGKMLASDPISSFTRRVLLCWWWGNWTSSWVLTYVVPSLAVSNFLTKFSDELTSSPVLVVMLWNIRRGKSAFICSVCCMVMVLVPTAGLPPELFPGLLVGLLL